MFWLVSRTVRNAPRRLLLAAMAVAFPVATLAATSLFVDDSVLAMTRLALQPVQVEMRAVATSLGTDMNRVGDELRSVPGVARVDLFSSTNVIVSAPGATGRVSARLFAVDQSYLQRHSWVHASGDLGSGALLNAAVAEAPGFAGAREISVELRGDTKPIGLTLPVAGSVDLREAGPTWFAIPAGDVQGDIAVVPRAVVVNQETFVRTVLPALRAAYGRNTAVVNPALSELPPVSLEAHLAVDHRSYPSDPTVASAWSGALRRVIERRAPGELVVADNAAEPLAEAGIDATNAKVMFLLLGIPGVLVAAALGLAAASAITEAHRREDALLRLRGASETQLVRLALGQGAVAGAVGTVLGLAAATAGVSAVVGHPVWRDVPASRLVVAALAALAAGTITTAARLIPLVRTGRKTDLVTERRRLGGRWVPPWRRGRLDVVALVAGVFILAVNVAAGGLKPIAVQGQALALSFYVLLAPLALWAAGSLLVVRALLALLDRWSRPDRSRPLTTWKKTAMRWLGRRPARPAVAFVLGTLAIAFGTEVSTFVATYRSARTADTRAAFASDLRLTPITDRPQPLPDLGSDVAAVAPLRSVPARLGSDRKTILAVDVGSYRAASTSPPQIVQGSGLDRLAGDLQGVLIAQEVAKSFAVSPGDVLPVTVFPDDLDLSQKLDLHVVGVYRAFPPTSPVTEMVVTTAALPTPVAPPDLYLARVARGRDPGRVASGLREGVARGIFSVATINDRFQREQRSLTALNLEGLSRIETAVAGLVAAVGVAVLGAFLLIERRREFAVLRAIGAGTRQVLTGPLVEGSLVGAASLLVGIPLGLGLGILAVRVLGLFFLLPPPLVTVPYGGIVSLALLVPAASAFALGIALRRMSQVDPAVVLREP